MRRVGEKSCAEDDAEAIRKTGESHKKERVWIKETYPRSPGGLRREKERLDEKKPEDGQKDERGWTNQQNISNISEHPLAVPMYTFCHAQRFSNDQASHFSCFLHSTVYYSSKDPLSLTQMSAAVVNFVCLPRVSGLMGCRVVCASGLMVSTKDLLVSFFRLPHIKTTGSEVEDLEVRTKKKKKKGKEEKEMTM